MNLSLTSTLKSKLKLSLESLGWTHAELCRQIRERIENGMLEPVPLDDTAPDISISPDGRAQLPPLDLRARGNDEEAAWFLSLVDGRSEKTLAVVETALRLNPAKPEGDLAKGAPTDLRLASEMGIHRTHVGRIFAGKRVAGPAGVFSAEVLLRRVESLVGTVLELDQFEHRPCARVATPFGDMLVVGYEGWAPALGAEISPREFNATHGQILNWARDRFGLDVVAEVKDDFANEPRIYSTAHAENVFAQSALDAPFQELPAHEVNQAALFFEADHAATFEGQPCTLVIRQVGNLRLSSGFLGVADFNVTSDSLGVRHRRVAPGELRVEAAELDMRPFGGNSTRVAAIQVVLSEGRAVRWVPANTPDGGHRIGVDSANVAIFDAAAFSQLTHADHRRIGDYEVANLTESSPAKLLSFAGHEHVCAIVRSGWGDGSYPCYWGLDEQGNPVRLVVDFLVTSA